MEITAAAYARYSTDNQTENSIAYQMHEINGYCAKHNIRITHTFIDEGMSGTNTNRNGFQDMLKAAYAGEFSTIIVYDVSRGSRDIADWFQFRKQMREIGIRVISCHQQLGDPLDPNSFLQEFITVGLGHHFVLETRQKSLDGMSAAAREARFLGGVPPYGYGVKDQQYFIIPSEAAVVRQVFQYYYEGRSYNYIMEKLQIRKIVGRHGSHMNKNSLHYMLKNPRYAGIYIWNEYTYQVMRKYVGRKPNPRAVRIESAIPAIVSMEVWKGVQERMQGNAGRTRRVSSKRRTFLLSGLIKCGICGSNYISHCSRSKGHEYTYYCCSNRYGRKNQQSGCKSSPAKGDDLERFVVEAVKKCILEDTNFDELAQAIAKRYEEKYGRHIDVTAEQNELQSITQKLNNGIQAVLSGLDSPELREQIQNLKTRKQILEDTINRAAGVTRSVDADALAAMLRADVEHLESMDPEAIRVVIKRHVPYIIANDDGSFTVPVGYMLPTNEQKKGKKISPTGRERFELTTENEKKAPEGKHQKTPAGTGSEGVAHFVAGAVRLELTTYGFGDRCSTN